MRILLLQEERYLPTFGGGHKANRRLLEELARRGHACLAICAAHHPDTPAVEFLAEMAARGVHVRPVTPWLFQYVHRGVAVDGLATAELARRSAWIERRIAGFAPDLVLVSDDPRRYLLAAALSASPGRVLFLVHNHGHLPFGPLAAQADAGQTARLRQVLAVLVMSRYSREYVALHAGLGATQVCLPVESQSRHPPPDLGNPKNRFVTLVKTLPGKGVGVFLALADRFGEIEFAAVPTWGRSPDAAVLAALRARANVHLLSPADDIDEILRQTRVLLVPSLFPETFGLLVPEAMARGVPVVASDAGALPEAKLGVDFVVPVRPMTGSAGEPPPQDEDPWAAALASLTSDRASWERCSRLSRQAALVHLESARVERCETLLGDLAGAS